MTDVADFFQHRQSETVSGNVGADDFGGNDAIDLSDAGQLFTGTAGEEPQRRDTGGSAGSSVSRPKFNYSPT